MAGPALRVIIDGDSNRIYRKGDKVSGRVILVVEEKEEVGHLKVIFAGNCVTKTSRPLYVNGKYHSASRREFEEKIRLFNEEKLLVVGSTLSAKKYTWTFEFTFPESTATRYRRLTHNTHYLKDPHLLPPSFQTVTNVPGGAAQISYFVQARLVHGTSREIKRCRHLLSYQPSPRLDLPREARCTSAVLYGQTWKPSRDIKQDSSSAVKQVFSKVSRRGSLNNSPTLIPIIHYPEVIAPGQHIPVSLTLRNTKDPLNETQQECILDSLSISMSTFTTSMCGHTVTDPEDVVSKHVTCIARTDMNQTISFGELKSLTSNFRLVNDSECVPTFKTYTVSRRYALSVSIGLKFGNDRITLRSNTPLEILTRPPRSSIPLRYEENEDFDPLPLYVPREPSKEFAPDYETACALSRTSSGSSSLSPTTSRSSSYMSDGSGVSTEASTPGSEIDQPSYECTVAQNT